MQEHEGGKEKGKNLTFHLLTQETLEGVLRKKLQRVDFYTLTLFIIISFNFGGTKVQPKKKSRRRL